MTRAQLLTGTLLDGASPKASVGRCDMLGLTSNAAPDFTWASATPDQIMADLRRVAAELGMPPHLPDQWWSYRWRPTPDPTPRLRHYGGPTRTGKTDAMRRAALQP